MAGRASRGAAVPVDAAAAAAAAAVDFSLLI